MSSYFRDFSYNIFMEIFQRRLNELRKASGISQKAFADILQTNNSSICDWERGRSQPDLETLAKIAVYFGVSSDYLLGLENEFGEKLFQEKTLV